MTILDGLKTLLFPLGIRCPLCEGLAPSKKDPLCSYCRNELNENTKNLRPCLKCGRFIGKKDVFCYECENTKNFPFITARSAGPYEGKLKQQIHLYKYLCKRSLAEPFSRMLYKVFKEDRSFSAIDCLVAIPLHENRLRERTFNQAEDIAKELAKKLGKPFIGDALWRAADTPTQVSLNRKQREQNLKNAFTVTNPNAIKSKSVLLIDDIFTTGTTVSESTKVLLNEGAHGVAVLTLASGKVPTRN